jgi:hypothetical protein
MTVGHQPDDALSLREPSGEAAQLGTAIAGMMPWKWVMMGMANGSARKIQ